MTVCYPVFFSPCLYSSACVMLPPPVSGTCFVSRFIERSLGLFLYRFFKWFHVYLAQTEDELWASLFFGFRAE